MNLRFLSLTRALQMSQIALVLILLFVAGSMRSVLAQDLGREVLAPEYSQLKMSLLHLHCQLGGFDGIACGIVLESPRPNGGGIPFPEVPGTGGNRSIIPRPRDPRNPMAGNIEVQSLRKMSNSISINAADIGFASYPVTFQLNGTRLADDLVRWEGFTPQPDFGVITDLGIGGGRRIIRIRGIGANLCTRVSQNSSPEDDGGLRFYKQGPRQPPDLGKAASDPAERQFRRESEPMRNRQFVLLNVNSTIVDPNMTGKHRQHFFGNAA